MPMFEHGEVQINYEVHGDGPAVLLVAPGGMRSAISFWSSTPWNPIEQLAGEFKVIAMDQRNAGASTGPVSADDGWHTYAGDQLALLDHLGVDEFQYAGMCIGGSYGFGLIEAAPSRVRSAALFQPIGLDNNRDAFYRMFDDWAELLQERRDAAPEDWSSFRENMYGGDAELFNVGRDDIAVCQTPLLLFNGDDLYHPASTSALIAATAPNVQVVETWKEGNAREQAMQTFIEFLRAHT